MKLKITIDMSNAAFQGDEGFEVARILMLLARLIKTGSMGMLLGATQPLRDANGNRVGEAKVTR
jgi:hypothetical protein